MTDSQFARPLDFQPLRDFAADLAPIVKRLWDAYEADERLNDFQPEGWPGILAASLDDWWHQIQGQIDGGIDAAEAAFDAKRAAAMASREERQRADVLGWLGDDLAPLVTLHGFAGEVVGGGAIELRRYWPQGQSVGINGTGPEGMPSAGGWCVFAMDCEGETLEQFYSGDYPGAGAAGLFAAMTLACTVAERENAKAEREVTPCPVHRRPLAFCPAACHGGEGAGQ